MAKITDYAKTTPSVSANYLRRRGQEIHDGALEHAATGATTTAICKALGISPATMRAICQDDPAFRAKLLAAQEDASSIVLDTIRDVPYTEASPAMARVKIDALRTYLELKWPHRYGKRLDITVKTLDMGKALELARQRAAQRQQPLDITAQCERVSTDGVSVDDPQTLDPALLALLE